MPCSLREWELDSPSSSSLMLLMAPQLIRARLPERCGESGIHFPPPPPLHPAPPPLPKHLRTPVLSPLPGLPSPHLPEQQGQPGSQWTSCCPPGPSSAGRNGPPSDPQQLPIGHTSVEFGSVWKFEVKVCGGSEWGPTSGGDRFSSQPLTRSSDRFSFNTSTSFSLVMLALALAFWRCSNARLLRSARACGTSHNNDVHHKAHHKVNYLLCDADSFQSFSHQRLRSCLSVSQQTHHISWP